MLLDVFKLRAQRKRCGTDLEFKERPSSTLTIKVKEEKTRVRYLSPSGGGSNIFVRRNHRGGPHNQGNQWNPNDRIELRNCTPRGLPYFCPDIFGFLFLINWFQNYFLTNNNMPQDFNTTIAVEMEGHCMQRFCSSQIQPPWIWISDKWTLSLVWIAQERPIVWSYYIVQRDPWKFHINLDLIAFEELPTQTTSDRTWLRSLTRDGWLPGIALWQFPTDQVI